MTRHFTRRRSVVVLTLVCAAALAGVALAFITHRGDEYHLHARFDDAGQLVPGAAVRIAGRKVGRIERLQLTADGQADARLEVDADDGPLHMGTRAQIRATGQAGIANRYIELLPGPRGARELPDDATLSTRWTKGIVDIDAVLDTVDPSMRDAMQRLIAGGASMFAGSGADDFNVMLRRLDPALSAVAATSEDLSADTRALSTLVQDSAVAATALAHRPRALEGSVVHTAGALTAIARRRAALASSLEDAPRAFGEARLTLADVSRTARNLRPTLRDLTAALPSANRVLHRVVPALGAARPMFTQLSEQLPDLRSGLAAVRRIAPATVLALRGLARAAAASAPIARGLRIYGADFVLGVTNGLAGIITSNYNRVGHYGRLNFVENPQTLVAGLPSSLLSQTPLVPGLLSTRTGITALCPGGNEPPAPDGSNRVVADRSLCDPSQSIPASVDQP